MREYRTTADAKLSVNIAEMVGTDGTVAAGEYAFGLAESLSFVRQGFVVFEIDDAGNVTVKQTNDEPETNTGPQALPEEALTAENAGNVTVTSVSHDAVTVSVGAEYAGVTVFGTLYSTPTSLGSAVVDDKGFAIFKIPSGVHPGAHKIAIQLADGTLIGWAPVTLSTNKTAEESETSNEPVLSFDEGATTGGETKLAETGGASGVATILAGVLLLGSGAGITLLGRNKTEKLVA